MHPTEYNLDLMQAMLAEMEPYLLSEEVFWALSAQSRGGLPSYPRLTIGGFLLTMDELTVQRGDMTPEQAHTHKRLEIQYRSIHAKWAAAIDRKARKEMNSRCNLWHAYVEELEEKQKVPYDHPRELRQRVMFERLLEMVKIDSEIERLHESVEDVDKRFRMVSVPADFIWDDGMQSIYDRETYWYLYRALLEFNNP